MSTAQASWGSLAISVAMPEGKNIASVVLRGESSANFQTALPKVRLYMYGAPAM
jgi:hypothetical protein